MKKSHFLVVPLIISISLMALGTMLIIQAPAQGTKWKISLPGSDVVEATSDGGFIMTGMEYDYPSTDFWLKKLDMNGSLQWSKVYPDANFSVPVSSVQTADGGYIISGYTFKPPYFNFDAELLLVKVDEYGNQQWNKTYAVRSDATYFAEHTSDGGCVLLGGYNASIIKIGANGSEQWNRDYYFHSRVIRQSSDGGYLLLQYDSSEGYYSSILKLNGSGYEEWNRTILYGLDSGSHIQQTSDGGCLLCGTSDNRATLLKLFSNGSTQWTCKYNEGGSRGRCALQTADGGYIAAVTAPWWFVGDRVWLWKTDANGVTLWCKPLDTSDVASFVWQTPGGDYGVLGTYGIELVEASGSPLPFSLDAVSAIYFASWWLLLATAVSSIVIGLTPRGARFAGRYRDWREKKRLERDSGRE